jgi:hypothetical protein
MKKLRPVKCDLVDDIMASASELRKTSDGALAEQVPHHSRSN